MGTAVALESGGGAVPSRAPCVPCCPVWVLWAQPWWEPWWWGQSALCSRRAAALQQGLRGAVAVPLALAETVSPLWPVLRELALCGNLACQSDLQVRGPMDLRALMVVFASLPPGWWVLRSHSRSR